jgi:hypothetical protein
MWRQFSVATSNFFLGVDLGQAQDYSALAILEYRPDRQCPSPGPVYDCSSVRRWPLGTDYHKVVSEMVKLIYYSKELHGCHLAIDQTGVGRPIVEMFTRALFSGAQLELSIHPIAITAGIGESYHPPDQSFHIAKSILVSTALAAMGEGRLRYTKQGKEVETVKNELRNFRTKVTAAGNETFLAREGQNDDILLAVTMAAWLLECDQRRRAVFEGPVVYESGMVYESDRKNSQYGEKPGTALSPEEHNRRIAEEYRRREAQWDAEDDAWEARREAQQDVWRGAPRGNPLRGAPGRNDSWIW